MSIDAKLFVTCGKDKMFDVVNTVVSQLNTWVREELDAHWTATTDAASRAHFMFSEEYQAQSKLFTNGVTIHAYNMDVISIDFGCGDENRRSLKVIPDCTSDYSDIHDGEKIIFSVGHWGKHNSIMNQVAIAVSQFGDVYYDHNDCDDEGFVHVFDFASNSNQFKGE
jgi:hypothetical protein